VTTLFSFEGASDDIALVIIDGVPAEYDAYDGAQFHIVSRQGQVQVTLEIDDDSGCWSVALGQTSTAYPIPKWAREAILEQSPDSDAATRITLTAPADAELVVTR
jgi:hypothetical protein